MNLINIVEITNPTHGRRDPKRWDSYTVPIVSDDTPPRDAEFRLLAWLWWDMIHPAHVCPYYRSPKHTDQSVNFPARYDGCFDIFLPICGWYTHLTHMLKSWHEFWWYCSTDHQMAPCHFQNGRWAMINVFNFDMLVKYIPSQSAIEHIRKKSVVPLKLLNYLYEATRSNWKWWLFVWECSCVGNEIGI